MPLTFHRKHQAKTRNKLLVLIKECKLDKLAVKKVGVHKIPVKIDRYLYWLIFSKPAKVVGYDLESWTLDIKMKLSLLTSDPYLPESKGTVLVRYNILYEAVSDEVQLRGARIEEMDFLQKLKGRLQEGMKKKAGKLNLTVPIGDCYKR